MKLVFFDIECASVYKNCAKICAFGYVVCDEQFNIIEKQDILINPKGKFHLTDGRGEHGLVLPYEYSEFKKYPVFPQVYQKIRELLTDKDSLIFGHATLNDVRYLLLEVGRFKLKPMSFDFSDSQLMYMTSIGDFSRQFGLSYITQDLDVEFTPHRAADDAYATMKVVEALCKKHGCKSTEIDAVLGIKKGRLCGRKIIRPDSKAFSEYRAFCEREKSEKSRKKVQFYKCVNSRHRAKNKKLANTRFIFSRGLEIDTQLSIPLLEKIFERGGKYASKLSDCSVYVCEENDDSVRTAAARKTEGVKVVSVAQLTEMLND